MSWSLTETRQAIYLERAGGDPEIMRDSLRKLGKRAGRTGGAAKRAQVRSRTDEAILAKMEREPFDVAGPELAWANVDAWWRDCARRAIAYLADLDQPFEAYDLTLLGVPDPDHPSRWGGAFAAARAAGVIKGTRSYAPSRRPGRHGSIVRLWRGKTR